jgi:hypothetical protein
MAALAAFFAAAETGSAATVHQLFVDGFPLALARSDDNYALRVAARKGHHEVLQLLFDRGLTSDDARARNRETLRAAAAKGRTDALRVLLTHGMAADVHECGVLRVAVVGSTIGKGTAEGGKRFDEVLLLLTEELTGADAAGAGSAVRRAWHFHALSRIRTAMLCCNRVRAAGAHVPLPIWLFVLEYL